MRSEHDGDQRVATTHKPRWIFVAVTGVTNGGKTSLIKHLVEQFPGSEAIHQDLFFRLEEDPNHEMVPQLNHANWETLASVDWDRLLDDLKQRTALPPPEKSRLFIVDGHIVLNVPRLAGLFERKYFFTLTKEECFRRRQQRHYVPPDPPGYFDLVVWPMYLSNKRDVEATVADVRYLDGAADMAEIHRLVRDDLEALLKSES
ncbi:nicotinamide riboside kinase 1 [Ixodes scapularis]|uniref:nicotinamide riboside kinase 1 n=1 Tax=Ixodes scapularis TaxID=6945 RepID=UPI0011255FD1|nr:nicotinamide riboside kinase 1 [Ixodes scapularis]